MLILLYPKQQIRAQILRSRFFASDIKSYNATLLARLAVITLVRYQIPFRVMTAIRIRRYTKTYEQLLLSPLCSVLIGLLVTVVMPAVFYWGPHVLSNPDRGQAWARVAASVALLVSSLWAWRVLSSDRKSTRVNSGP